MSLVARHLEANGIPTVIIGSVHRLLGAETPEPLRCYASQMHLGWEDTNSLKNHLSEYLETAQIARAQDYNCVKVCPVYVAPNGQRALKRGVFTPEERKKSAWK